LDGKVFEAWLLCVAESNDDGDDDAFLQVHKVKACHPNAVLLLRIRTDDRGARCPLGVKYGALMSEVEHLLCVAHDLRVPVAGGLALHSFLSLITESHIVLVKALHLTTYSNSET
jgi:hypothetical protein